MHPSSLFVHASAPAAAPAAWERIPDEPLPHLTDDGRCSCSGRIMEIAEVFGMRCARCGYDHALKVYRPLR